MKLDEKRESRLRDLYQKALQLKFTKDGFFEYSMLLDAAKHIGVSSSTAASYADAVIKRLEKAGHL